MLHKKTSYEKKLNREDRLYKRNILKMKRIKIKDKKLTKNRIMNEMKSNKSKRSNYYELV